MNKLCPICDLPLKEGQRVFIGGLSIYHEIPSRVAFAVDVPTEYTHIAHAACEGLEEPSGSED